MLRTSLWVFILGFTVSVALAQDPVRTDPKHYKVEFENDQVRVVRVHLGPHDKTPMHEHPAQVVVFLTDVHVKHAYPDGKTSDDQAKAGQVVWGKPTKHTGENLSDQPFELIMIEPKSGPAHATSAKVK